MNNVFFEVDIVSKNNRICLYDIRALDYNDETLNEKHFKKFEADSALIINYLKSRNSFYSSCKNIKDLFRDIENNKSYAMYCGDTSPKTQEGKNIDNLVQEHQTKVLTSMLQSISCETQAYRITGFDMLIKQGFKPDTQTLKMIDHIKKRNSPVLTCRGCLSGLLEKLYGE